MNRKISVTITLEIPFDEETAAVYDELTEEQRAERIERAKQLAEDHVSLNWLDGLGEYTVEVTVKEDE